MCTTWLSGAMEARRGHQIPWNWKTEVMNHCGGAGDRAAVLCESKCYYLLSHRSSLGSIIRKINKRPCILRQEWFSSLTLQGSSGLLCATSLQGGTTSSVGMTGTETLDHQGDDKEHTLNSLSWKEPAWTNRVRGDAKRTELEKWLPPAQFCWVCSPPTFEGAN